MTAAAPADIAAVREFNRHYTRVIGVLREGLHDSRYSLTEARILFELAASDTTEVVALRMPSTSTRATSAASWPASNRPIWCGATAPAATADVRKSG
ncbi:hypothetical protein [Nocardia niwae]|uniref:hypothetical protein n=1 Tax=Nocardia niwae TaxID=626084 RepID=UPI000A3FCE93|nr:hypothetical protein [Nocardia niwae]